MMDKIIENTHCTVEEVNRCHEEANKWKTLKALGGRGWDYYMGRQEA